MNTIFLFILSSRAREYADMQLEFIKIIDYVFIMIVCQFLNRLIYIYYIYPGLGIFLCDVVLCTRDSRMHLIFILLSRVGVCVVRQNNWSCFCNCLINLYYICIPAQKPKMDKNIHIFLYGIVLYIGDSKIRLIF